MGTIMHKTCVSTTHHVTWCNRVAIQMWQMGSEK